MAKPTEDAEEMFQFAKNSVRHMVNEVHNREWSSISASMVNLLNGLQYMAIAQRATYLKLEEIERKLGMLGR